MAVYVDDARIEAKVRSRTRTISAQWSHLSADTTGELLMFARRLGLKTKWLQHRGTPLEHFDVTESLRRRAVRFGAIEISYQDESAALTEAKRRGTAFDVEEVRAKNRARHRAWAMAAVLGASWTDLVDSDRGQLVLLAETVDGLEGPELEEQIRVFCQTTKAVPLVVEAIPALAHVCA